MGEAFHLVCHECPEEGVYEERRNAVRAMERHERETDHRMTFLNIADPRAGTSPADVEPST